MNRGWQGFRLWCAAAIAGLAVGTSGATPAEALRDLAGAPARLVWSRQPPPGDDPFVRGEALTLMGFDTEDGIGERIILPGPDSFHRPMLTPRGDRVVFNRHAANEIWVVGFDGHGLRRLGSGLAVDVWLDEEEGIEWVYHIPGETGWGKGHPVMRFVLDDPDRSERVWDRTEVTVDNFQLSRDGRMASGQFPHPMGGVAELPDVGWTFYYRGCWSSLAPDNSYITWVFDGAHRNLRFVCPRTDDRWSIPINVAPGVDGHEVYHPRWSNHRSLFAMTGPYTITGKGANPIYGGGDQVDVHVGRFSEDLRAVEDWVRVTASGQADFAPDLWVSLDAHADGPVEVEGLRREDTSEAWPSRADGVVFLWRDAMQSDRLRDAAGMVMNSTRVTARGRAFYGPHQQMMTAGGRFVPDDGQVELSLDAARERPELAVEAVVTAWPLSSFDAGVAVSLGESVSGGDWMALAREAGRWVLEVGSGRHGRYDLGVAEAGTPAHMAISASPDRLTAIRDGETVIDVTWDARAFEDLGQLALTLGSAADGQRPWRGTIERVAVYDRELTADEAVHHDALWRKMREARPVRVPSRVMADVIETTPTPTLAEIMPYRQALTVTLYRVTEGEAPLTAGEEILVAEWAVLDGEPIWTPPAAGTSRELLIEPYDAHPQLESERLLMAMNRYELPMYVNVGHP